MEYRAITKSEQKYTFKQSYQLSSQTGLIGYLRGDFGSIGKEFWTTWNDFRKDLKTDEFKAEFDDVINGLREGDVLSGRKAMSSYCCVPLMTTATITAFVLIQINTVTLCGLILIKANTICIAIATRKIGLTVILKELKEVSVLLIQIITRSFA